MGVRGLTTFVEKNQRSLYSKEKIQDCSLMIDGFGLLYHLYFDSGLDARLGGEYAALYDVICKFFKHLSLCNIKSYVIFDGPMTPDKLECVLKRMNEKIASVKNMMKGNGSNNRVLPLFAADVIQNALKDLQIPFAISLNDADAEIVAVANNLGCLILSSDSDLYIYDVTNGYLPISHFHWQEPVTDKQHGPWIVCQKYMRENMTQRFRIDESALPYISILLGNDWIPRETFAQFMDKSSRNKKRRNIRSSDGRVGLVIDWLARSYTTGSSMTDRLRAHLPKVNRKSVMESVEACLALYRDLPDVTKTLNILVPQENKGMHGMLDEKREEDELDLLVRQGNLHPWSLDLFHLESVFLAVIPCDLRKPSPHACSAEIRNFIYDITIWKYLKPNRSLTVTEFDIFGFSYVDNRAIEIDRNKCPICYAKRDLECKGCIASLRQGFADIRNFNGTPVFRILKFLSPKIGISNHPKYEFSSFSDLGIDFRVMLATTLFWCKNQTQNQVSICSLVLLITWSLLKHQSRNNASEMFREIQLKDNAVSDIHEGDNHALRASMESSAGKSSEGTVEKSGTKNNNTGEETPESREQPKIEEFSPIEETDCELLEHEKSGNTTQASALGESTSERIDCKKKEQSDPETAQQVREIQDPSRADEKPATECTGGEDQKKGPSELLKDEEISAEQFLNIICPWPLSASGSALENEDMDAEFLHSISEWQSILHSYRHLARILWKERLQPAHAFISSNVLLHEIYQRIKRLRRQCSLSQTRSMKSFSSIISGRLKDLPKLRASFDVLVHFLQQ